MPVLTDMRAAVAAAVLPLLVFLGAHQPALHPELPEWAMPQAEEHVAEEEKTGPNYLELDEPVVISIKGGQGQLKITMAFVAHLKGMDLLAVAGKVAERKPTIVAAINAKCLEMAEKDPDPARLRRDLPPVIRDIVNAELSMPEIPDPVDEVYVVEALLVYD